MKRKLFTICLASLQFACAAENLNNKYLLAELI